jgi:hypothetical protein
MPSTKRLNGTYTIDSTDVYLTGNLNVAGVYNTTTVDNTTIKDRDITLNSGETGWGVGGNANPQTSGLYVDRGLTGNVAIRFNEVTDIWELTEDGDTYEHILTSGATGGTGLEHIVEDLSPQLGGNLETNGFHIQFDQTTYVPTANVNNTKIYAGNVQSAGSGIYVVNSETEAGGDELVTKSKAIVFSLIL